MATTPTPFPVIKSILFAAGGIAGFIASRTIQVVPAGHVGIVDLFGNVEDKVKEPGLHFIKPLANMHKFSVKTQILTAVVDVPLKEGLNINLKVSALFKIQPSQVKHLYTTVGENYKEVILSPHLQESIWQMTSGYEAKDLYNAASRTKMNTELINHLRHAVEERGVVIEDTSFHLVIPETLTSAIEQKLKAEQESQRMEFVLEKERLEAERKQIEAHGIAAFQKIVSDISDQLARWKSLEAFLKKENLEAERERMEFVLKKEKLEAERKQIEAHGIAAFQKIVSDGNSDQLLRWKGIEVTKDLAESKNTKVIVVGGANGLPLIFNDSDKADV